MTIHLRSRRLACVALLFAVGAVLRAEITLAPLFVDHAVLQRGSPVPVWGRGQPGEKVTVTFAGQSRTTTADPQGRWRVVLGPLAMSATGADLVIKGTNTVTVHDVVVGEVWLCSGQSNMEMTVKQANDAEHEMAAANFPLIRHLKVRNTVAIAPAEAVATSGWESATPGTVGRFTAVGYFFARQVHQKLGVPVGIINSSWGSTPVESWMSPAAIASNLAFKVVDERWTQTLADYPAKKLAFEVVLGNWIKADEAARPSGKDDYAAWQKQNPRPLPPRGEGDRWTPAGLFNGMIHPLGQYALRGVLWYQGERNAADDRVGEYHALFSAMIQGWRSHLAQGDLPFYWVNLPNLAQSEKTGRRWAFLREAQTQALALPATGQAIAIDIGDPKEIHAGNKQDVAHRLGLLALNRVYRLPCEDTGPTLARSSRERRRIRVRFTHGRGLKTSSGEVRSLEVAGLDQVFHPAEGKIEGETLLVFSAAVKDPVAVRYAWVNAPEANLYNGAGLPAVPFRSDRW